MSRGSNPKLEIRLSISYIPLVKPLEQNNLFKLIIYKSIMTSFKKLNLLKLFLVF